MFMDSKNILPNLCWLVSFFEFWTGRALVIILTDDHNNHLMNDHNNHFIDLGMFDELAYEHQALRTRAATENNKLSVKPRRLKEKTGVSSS